MDSSSSNKRIAKNTLLLYIRMIFLLCISFYTTRAILDALGVVDLGIYNVVGGVVAMFGFVNGSLSSASSRFITYTLGTNDKKELNKTFNTIISVHILFGIIIFLLAESVGLWFVLSKLVIPAERLYAAFWVYQSAVISSVLVITTSPFNADIIAHEKMSAFAYISIYEAIAKLGIVFILFHILFDKLITYAVLLVLVQSSVMFLYWRYCYKHFVESHFRLHWAKDKVKVIFTYAGWVMTGSFAYICCTQGINILLNMFFGPAVNAARALATQLQGAINQFTTNFQTAVKPQITKTYAVGDYNRMHTLVLTSSKLGAFLMLMLLTPVIIESEFILGLWLKQVPEHTVTFVRIMLLMGVISAMKDPTMTAIHATGDIKKAEVVEMSFMLSFIPIAYVLLKYMGLSAEGAMLLYLLTELITQFARVWVIYPRVGLKKREFLYRVFLPTIATGAVAIIISVIIHLMLERTIVNSILMIAISELTILFSIMMIGLNKNERMLIASKVAVLVKKIKN